MQQLSGDIHPRKTLLAYGCFALPLSLAELPLIVYLPTFYAKERGMELVTIGLIFTLARLWDGLTDILVGRYSDRWSQRFGGRKTWAMVGTPPLLFGTWYLFNPPEQIDALYLSVWLIVFYTSLTICKIPYWSWGAELATDYQQRNRVASFREGSSMVALFVFASAPLFILQEGASIESILGLYAILVAGFLLLTIMPLATQVPTPKLTSAGSEKLWSDLLAIKNNPSMLLFGSVVLLVMTGVSVISSSAIFLIDVGLSLPDAMLKFIFIQQCLGLLSIPLLMFFSNRFGKHKVYRFCVFMMILFYLYCLWIPSGNFFAALMFFACMSIPNTGISVLLLSIVSDIVDYDTAKTGVYRPGVYFSMLNLVIKLGTALGIGINFWLLDLLNFDPAAAEHSANDVLNVRLVALLIPVALYLPVLWILKKYPINKHYHGELRREIEEKKQVNSDRENAADTPSVLSDA